MAELEKIVHTLPHSSILCKRDRKKTGLKKGAEMVETGELLIT